MYTVRIGDQAEVIGCVGTIRKLVDILPGRIESIGETIKVLHVISAPIIIPAPNHYTLLGNVALQLLVGIIVGRGVGGHFLESLGLPLQVVETTGDTLDDMALGIIAILA